MTVSPALVVKIVTRLFGSEEAERVLQVLDQCSADVPAAERDRVHLAVLRLYDSTTRRDTVSPAP